MAEEITEVQVDQETEEVKETFTKEEVEALKAQLEKEKESYADKRVNSAIEKKKAEWQQQAEVLKEEAKKEASMTEAEKLQAQFEKEREAFEKERAEFEKAKLEASTMKNLSNEGLPPEFATYLLGKDEETTQENITQFKDLWDAKLQEMVEERLAGKTPRVKPTDVKNTTQMKKSEFYNLPYEKRMKLLAEDPELTNKLV